MLTSKKQTVTNVKRKLPKSISEMTFTEMLALPYSDVVARVASGEWGVDQFTQWAEDRLNYAFGDGYDEGYTTAEERVTCNHDHCS